MAIFIIVLVFFFSVAGLVWAYYNFTKLRDLPISELAHMKLGRMQDSAGEDLDEKLVKMGHSTPEEIGEIIAEGASEFITSEYQICSIFVLLMAVIVFVCVDKMESPYTTFAFVFGAVTSMLCGAIGMKVATFSNYRTTLSARKSLGEAFRTAFRAGCVIGFTLVSISMAFLLILILVYKSLLQVEDMSLDGSHYEFMFEAIAGYGLGGSTIALFARVGGGIYTKAADLGSDLVGKVEQDLPEDSPKNPATIADNVGDNVGDVAGMSADLFGSFAEATCAALVIGGNSITAIDGVLHFSTFLFVLAIPAVGMFVCIIVTFLITDGSDIVQPPEVEASLKKQLIFSTVGLIPSIYLLSLFLLDSFVFVGHDGLAQAKGAFDVFICVILGLVAGLAIGYITEIMTSYSHKPVIELAEACKTGAATNIIYGLALGYLSTIIPVILLCLVCYYSHSNLGYYGVALAALGMLSNLPICLAIDGYGPISDNAGGISEMANLENEVRQRTDVLDSAGNTTAAIGKGFAIGSATLVGFALYGAFIHTCYILGSLKVGEMSFDDPMIFSSLLFGSMMPYAFSALTMKSVGKAALGMIEEVRRQIRQNPGIKNGTTRPDYRACIRISTQASLKEMILPGLLVTVTPFALGFLYGPKALLGFLPGAIVSGVQMAISASNTGGAWDNAKKYIQARKMIVDGKVIEKRSEIHKAAVIGDTVGDPLKDTSGPSLNILIKLMAILSLVFCEYFSRGSLF